MKELKKHLKSELEVYRKLMDNSSNYSQYQMGKHRGMFFAYKSILDKLKNDQ